MYRSSFPLLSTLQNMTPAISPLGLLYTVRKENITNKTNLGHMIFTYSQDLNIIMIKNILYCVIAWQWGQKQRLPGFGETMLNRVQVV